MRNTMVALLVLLCGETAMGSTIVVPPSIAKEIAPSEYWPLMSNAPLIPLTGKNRKSTSMVNYKDDLLIVVIWASWCEYCKAQLQDLHSNMKKYSGKPYRVVAVSVDENQKDAERAAKKLNLPFTMVFSADSQFREKLGIQKIPVQYLFNAQRDFRARLTGTSRAKFELLLKTVESELKGSA